VRGCEQASAAGIRPGDQEYPNKCGHTPGRRVVSAEPMVEGGRPPVLPPAQLAALAVRDRLVSFSEMTELMGFEAVRDFDRRHAH